MNSPKTEPSTDDKAVTEEAVLIIDKGRWGLPIDPIKLIKRSDGTFAVVRPDDTPVMDHLNQPLVFTLEQLNSLSGPFNPYHTNEKPDGTIDHPWPAWPEDDR